MNDASNPSRDDSRLLAHLKLLRIPNVFTAVADVMMGYAFSHPQPGQTLTLLALIATSCCLYLSGMVLNDVFDYEVDKSQRPHRPLPAGQISRRYAAVLGGGLLTVGITMGWLTGWLFSDVTAFPWRPGAIATVLGLTVLLYDGVLKCTPLAPVAMGACRFLNVLLGMSAAPRVTGLLDFTPGQWLVASGMGIYVAGITMFARHEAETSRRGQLVAALIVMVTGVAMLAGYPVLSATPTSFTHPAVWPSLALLLTLPVWRRAVTAISHPIPRHVQRTVKTSIMTLIVLNAGICLAIPGPFTPAYALGVLALLVPSLLLGRWIYST